MQRCRAKSKRSGVQCKNFALKHCKVCRMHGAHGGPKTREGLIICKKAPRIHGCYTHEAQEEYRFMRKILKEEELPSKWQTP